MVEFHLEWSIPGETIREVEDPANEAFEKSLGLWNDNTLWIHVPPLFD